MAVRENYIEEFQRELGFYGDYLEESGFEHEIISPAELGQLPVLSVLLDEDGDEEFPLVLHYMFVEPEDEDEDDEEEDDVFGHTNYLQALVAFPVKLETEAQMLDVFLFCSMINQQLPLGMVYVSTEKTLILRHVFPLDREVGLTREVFLETLYMLNFIAEQVDAAVTPLAAGECEVGEAMERYMMPV